MKFLVDQIKDRPLHLHIDEPIQSFSVLAAMNNSSECVFTSGVSGDLTVVLEFDHLRLNGTLLAPIKQVCSRCVADYESVITADFTLILRKAGSNEIIEEDETELGELDLISSVYSGDEIDLTHEIEEQIAMEIPIKPLCSEGCKGLCPSCGADLNQTNCSCDTTPVNFKFSALKDFKVAK